MWRQSFTCILIVLFVFTVSVFTISEANAAVGPAGKASTTWAGVKAERGPNGATTGTLAEGVRSVQAAPPKNSVIYKYITDVTPVKDGVQVTLGPNSILLGCNLGWAKVFADWTISEYERQSGKKWPYNKRSRDSVAREIMAHCWSCLTPFWPRAFPINIGFNERIWD